MQATDTIGQLWYEKSDLIGVLRETRTIIKRYQNPHSPALYDVLMGVCQKNYPFLHQYAKCPCGTIKEVYDIHWLDGMAMFVHHYAKDYSDVIERIDQLIAIVQYRVLDDSVRYSNTPN